MNLLVTTEARFDRTPDGTTWTQTVFDRGFWERYLEVFDGVRVLARTRDVAQVPPEWRRVDGDGVTIVPIPHYRGPWQYLARRSQVIAAVREASQAEGAVLFRIPSVLAAVLHAELRRTGRPYAVEVVGDPREIFARGVVKTPLRPFLRAWLTGRQRVQCREALAAAYVTRNVLQRAYPPGPAAACMEYSSVDLPRDLFAVRPRSAQHSRDVRTVVAVGSLEQLYKGPDVLIDAVKMLVENGLPVRLVWVGNGMYRPSLEQRVRALGLADRIRFAGELPPGAAVTSELDRADLFVLPSRSEGLPRAMIEAMARGLPCLGSHVGGVPELLPPEDMVAPGDAAALAEAMRRVLSDPERMARMSARNLEKAGEYRADALQARRLVFYRHLREQTMAWASGRRRPRLLVAVTDSVSCLLLRGQLAYARERGYDVGLLCTPGELARRMVRSEGPALLPVPMERKPAPWRDLVALGRVWAAVRRFRPDIVSAGTPKAAFLVVLAAWMCRVPCRIYTLRGLFLETSSGPRRALLGAVERITCALAHRVVCVSPSLRERAVALGLVPERKAVVLGRGSSNGVDLARFAPSPELRLHGQGIREGAGIDGNAVVIGFVGRFVRDKGVLELARAWTRLRGVFPDAHLLLVGWSEDGEVPAATVASLGSDPRVHLASGMSTPIEHYYAAMDVVVLPTYREGLPNVLLEAGAMGLPAVASRVTGCIDVVEDGVTGTLVPPRDPVALADALAAYLRNADLRVRHGRAARERIERDFASEAVWGALHDEYARLLHARGLPLPRTLAHGWESDRATAVVARPASIGSR